MVDSQDAVNHASEFWTRVLNDRLRRATTPAQRRLAWSEHFARLALRKLKEGR